MALPSGLMFPRRSRLFCAPFTDAALFAEISSRGSFWQNDNFYGVDLRRALPAATDEAFRQPIVGAYAAVVLPMQTSVVATCATAACGVRPLGVGLIYACAYFSMAFRD